MAILPKVSVIVPAYNLEPYLKTALNSVRIQSYENFEALIIDDGSTDNTAEIALAFCQKDSRFRLLQKPNGGLSSARNYGIRNALGEYIALLDGDDLYLPDKLATHVNVLENSPTTGVVYSATRAIRDDGKRTFMVISGKPINSNCLVALLYKNFIAHGSNAVFRSSLISEVGEFDETLSSCEDLDFWLRVAATQCWQFYRLPKVLCCYRVRPSGLSFDVKTMEQTQQIVIQSAYNRSPAMVKPRLSKAHAYMYRYLARVCLSSGDKELAHEYLNRAWLKDASIFVSDWRSLMTLIAVTLAPIAELAIRKTLGTAELTAK